MGRLRSFGHNKKYSTAECIVNTSEKIILRRIQYEFFKTHR